MHGAEPHAAAAKLVIEADGSVIARVDLNEDAVFIGRDASCQIRLDDPEISGFHCCLRRAADGRWWLEDLGSTNGTFVGDRRLAGKIAVASVVVRVGRHRLRLEEREALAGTPASTPSHAEPSPMYSAPRSRVRWLTIAALGSAVIAAAFVWGSRGRADEHGTPTDTASASSVPEADTDPEPARSHPTDDPLRAALVAAEALARDPASSASSALRAALGRLSHEHLYRGRSPVTAVAARDDGRFVAAAEGQEGVVRIFDRSTQTLQVLLPRTEAVTWLAFAGEQLLVASSGSVSRWTLVEGRISAVPSATLPLKSGDVMTAWALDGDQTTLLAGTRDGRLLLWDLEGNAELVPRPSGAEFDSVELGGAPVVVVASSGDEIFAGLTDGTCVRIDPATRRRTSSSCGASTRLVDAAFADGWAVAAFEDGKISALEKASRTPVELATRAELTAVDVTPDGSLALVALAGGGLEVWDLRRQRPELTSVVLDLHDAAVTHLLTAATVRASSPRDPSVYEVVTASGDGTLVSWMLERREREQKGRRTSVDAAPTALAFGCGGACLVIGDASGAVQLWAHHLARSPGAAWVGHHHAAPVVALALAGLDAVAVTGDAHGELVRWSATLDAEPRGELLERGAAPITAIAASIDRIATGDERGRVVLRSLANPDEAPLREAAHRGRVTSLQFDSGARRLVSTSTDAVAVLRDLPRGTMHRLPHDDEVRDALFSPDGRRLVIATIAAVHVWSVAGEQPHLEHRFDDHALDLVAIAFSPDGRTLASADANGLVSLRDLERGGTARQLVAHEEPVQALEFSRDGRWLASAGTDATVRVWPLAEGQAPAAGSALLAGHEGTVRVLRFAPDGAALLGGGDDGTLWYWPLDGSRSGFSTAEHLGRHDAAIGGLAVASDGRFAVTSSLDETVRWWPLRGSDLVALACARTGGNYVTAGAENEALAVHVCSP